MNKNKDNDWKSIKFDSSNELQLFAMFTAYRNNDGIPTDADLKEDKYIIHKSPNKRRKVCDGNRYDIFADVNINDKSVEEYEWCCGIDIISYGIFRLCRVVSYKLCWFGWS